MGPAARRAPCAQPTSDERGERRRAERTRGSSRASSWSRASRAARRRARIVAGEDELPVGVDVHEVHAVRQRAEDERADDGADHGGAAAVAGCVPPMTTAVMTCSSRMRPALPGVTPLVRAAATMPAHAPCSSAGDEVDGDGDARDRHAREARGLGVAADGEGVAAEPAAARAGPRRAATAAAAMSTGTGMPSW